MYFTRYKNKRALNIYEHYLTITNNMKLTIICCPKPFLPNYRDIQYNAIVSWIKLGEKSKKVKSIVMCGIDEGVEDFAKSIKGDGEKVGIDIIYHPTVKTNEFKTPLISDIFDIAKMYSGDDAHMCYVNSDIILLPDFMETFEAFVKDFPEIKKFNLIGLRYDWKHPKLIDFSKEEWRSELVNTVKKDGEMHPDTGIDYFIFSKDTYPFIHPFALGRQYWDQWLVGNAYRRTDVVTVDLSETVFIIHQDSPWLHEGQMHLNSMKMYNSVEGVRNRSYDSFVKTIHAGTRWKSKKVDGGIVFIKK